MTEEQKQALIEWLKPQIDELQNVSDEVPFGLDSDSAMHLNTMRVALAALTAQPDDWKQRAEAAEAKLAELGASVPVYQYESAIYNEENGDTDWYWDDCDKGFYDQYDPSRRRILFTRPAPAINLAPVSNCLSFFASVIKSGESWSATCQRDLDAARRALRDAEEAK